QVSEPVEIAMRYGNPTAKDGFDNLLKIEPGLEEVIAVPLYPHYAMSSYETAVEHARGAHKSGKYAFKLQFVKPFYDDASYLAALADRVSPYLSQAHDHILFSYHGIPARHIHRDDPKATQICLALNGT